MTKAPDQDTSVARGGRIDTSLITRCDDFVDRCLNVVDELGRAHVSQRVLDQLTGASTSVGANLAEASEALSRKDFCKHVAIAIKELCETRYWLRLAGRRGWVATERLVALDASGEELKRILGSILTRTRAKGLSGV